MNFWNTTNSWVGNYIKVYNKEKILHDKRFPFYKKKKNQILLPILTESSGKSPASKKNGQSPWTSLCIEESFGMCWNIRTWTKEKRGNTRNPANCFHSAILFILTKAKLMFL